MSSCIRCGKPDSTMSKAQYSQAIAIGGDIMILKTKWHSTNVEDALFRPHEKDYRGWYFNKLGNFLYVCPFFRDFGIMDGCMELNTWVESTSAKAIGREIKSIAAADDPSVTLLLELWERDLL